MDIFFLNIAASSSQIDNLLSQLSASPEVQHHRVIKYMEIGSEPGSSLCLNISQFVATSILDNMKFLSLNHLNEKKEYFSYLKDFLDHKKELAIQISEILLYNIDTQLQVKPDDGGISFNFGTLIFFTLVQNLDTSVEAFVKFSKEEGIHD